MISHRQLFSCDRQGKELTNCLTSKTFFSPYNSSRVFVIVFYFNPVVINRHYCQLALYEQMFLIIFER